MQKSWFLLKPSSSRGAMDALSNFLRPAPSISSLYLSTSWTFLLCRITLVHVTHLLCLLIIHTLSSSTLSNIYYSYSLSRNQGLWVNNIAILIRPQAQIYRSTRRYDPETHQYRPVVCILYFPFPHPFPLQLSLFCHRKD
jgi:hypothetical protein